MSGERIMAHMVAHYTDRAASLSVARGLLDGGCSYLEVQFPFSDPTADGPDIQAACTAALAAGFTVTDGFRLVAEIHHEGVPIFLMSYANMLFTHGIEKFLTRCAASGVAGVIVPDLPPDYDEGLFEAAARRGLSAVPVVSPSMREERLRRVGALRPRYIYATLRTGTTGALTEWTGTGFHSWSEFGPFPRMSRRKSSGDSASLRLPRSEKWRRTCTRWLSAARWSGRLPGGETPTRRCSEK